MEKKELKLREAHEKAMARLMERRKSGSIKRNPVTGDYDGHFKKVKIGASVLDVGCGGMDAKAALMKLPKPPHYTGLDAFPVNDGVVRGKIEDYAVADKSYDTLIAFAVMDGVEDIDKTMANMNRIAKENIVILTGIGIEVDDCHTFKITEDMLVRGFKDFALHFKEQLQPKIWLYDFWRSAPKTNPIFSLGLRGRLI